MSQKYQIELTLQELQRIDDVLYHAAWEGNGNFKTQEERDFIHKLWVNINGQLLVLTDKNKIWR